MRLRQKSSIAASRSPQSVTLRPGRALIGMGLKKHNNPLGQHRVYDKVGPDEAPGMEHNQSAEFVEEVKRRADEGKNNAGREPLNTPLPLQKKVPRSPDATPYQEPGDLSEQTNHKPR